MNGLAEHVQINTLLYLPSMNGDLHKWRERVLVPIFYWLVRSATNAVVREELLLSVVLCMDVEDVNV